MVTRQVAVSAVVEITINSPRPFTGQFFIDFGEMISGCRCVSS